MVATTCASLSKVTVLRGYALPVKTTLVLGIPLCPDEPPPPPPPPPELPTVQDSVTYIHGAEHETLPLLNPKLEHDAPPKFEPSHCSPTPIRPSPQPGTKAVISTVIAYADKGRAQTIAVHRKIALSIQFLKILFM